MVTIGCPEVPLEFSVLCFQKGVRRTQVAAWGHGCGSFGGRIRISTSRCPEVGLEFQLHAVSAPGVAREREKARGECLWGSQRHGRASRGEGEIKKQKRDPEKEIV